MSPWCLPPQRSDHNMPILSFLVQLFGATMLLLFAVRMVRTGIERAFGASFRRLVTTADRGALALAPVGVMLAVILQSSAAVTLLVAGFAASGAVAFVPGLAIVLGGDLGSALLIQVLSLKLDWMAPVLLGVGGILFLKTERRGLKQAGRIVLGIAFILLALRFLRETVEPIREGSFLPVIAAYLERDFISAFLAGVVLAFVMHSSVAVVLMCVTLVSIGGLPFGAGASLVLGANLGSALIPMWLARGMPPQARRIPTANLLLRGSAAVIVLILINRTTVTGYLPSSGSAQGIIFLHIIFNALLLLTLPFIRFLEPPVAAMLPLTIPADTDAPHHRSVLDETLLDQPGQALPCLRREILRMAGLVGDMLAPVMEIYATYDRPRVLALKAQDHRVNKALDEVRRYAAAMPGDALDRTQKKERRALVDYAIALEAAGDIIVKRLLPLAEEKALKSVRFSKPGRAELEGLHNRTAANLQKAANVLISQDVEGARLLLEEKAEMARLERASRKKHLKRLSADDADSFASSDIHLETAYSLKEMNSWVVTVAHPILVAEGQLLETRLIQDIEPEGDEG